MSHKKYNRKISFLCCLFGNSKRYLFVNFLFCENDNHRKMTKRQLKKDIFLSSFYDSYRYLFILLKDNLKIMSFRFLDIFSFYRKDNLKKKTLLVFYTIWMHNVCYFKLKYMEIIFQIPKYQNTYRLEPYKPFKCEIVDMILIDVMQDYLVGLKYQSQVCMQMCQKMSEEVRYKICREFYNR